MFFSWDISGKCNARCKFCSRWKKSKKELSTKQKLKIINELGKLKTWMISLCGGEPLLMKDFEVIVKAIKKNDMLLNVTTNGYFLKEKADFLIKNKVDYLIVSIDSCDPKEHNKNKGVNDMFERAIEGIKYIKKIRKGDKPFLSVRIIVHAENFKEIGNIIDFCKKEVDEVLLQPINFSKKMDYTPEKKFLEFDKKVNNVKEAKEEFPQTLKKRRMLNKYNAEILNFIFSKEVLKCKYKCFSMFFFLCLDESGILWNCGGRILKLGDLKKNSLKEILSGKKLKKLKNTFEKNRNCICWENYAMLNAYLSKIFKLLSPNQK